MSGFEVHQEEDVVAPARLVRIALVSLAVGGVGVLVAAALLIARVGAVIPSFAGPGGARPSTRQISQVEQTPILDTRAAQDLRDAQRRELESWGWVDQDAGIARIPIERAMDVVARGSSR